jgi:preprotein translocase subunit SecA
MPGRRFSDGLHQALEAKENVNCCKGESDSGINNFSDLFQNV